MRKAVKLLSLCLVLGLALAVAGCNKSSSKTADNDPPKKQEVNPADFTIGKSTKEEVIAKMGQPTGRAVATNGEETITYHSGHMTGKAFIPFYFGSDRYRTHEYKYVFDKKGILTSMSTDDKKY